MQSTIPEIDKSVKERKILFWQFHSEFNGISYGVKVVYKFEKFLQDLLPYEEDAIQLSHIKESLEVVCIDIISFHFPHMCIGKTGGNSGTHSASFHL